MLARAIAGSGLAGQRLLHRQSGARQVLREPPRPRRPFPFSAPGFGASMPARKGWGRIMTTEAAAPAAARPVFGPLIVPLLALAIFINYVDRGNLATAAPLLKTELSLSASQIGVLISAFFWAYTPGLILAGWLADRVNAYLTLAVGLAIWSL